MISIHASAVCRVLDGYTGQPLEGSSLECTLDGVPCRPVSKPGGYLVLVNLAPGEHRLSLCCHGFQEEWVAFQADDGTRELDITMKPGAGYPFRQTITRLELTVEAEGMPAAGRQLWIAAEGQPQLKLAQTKAEAGESQLRLYAKGPEAAVPTGVYLIADGSHSEIVGLRALQEERGTLAAPLRYSHSRGKLLLPAQRYHTGTDGRLTAVFQAAGIVQVYAEDASLMASLTLEEGDNRQTIQL